MNKREFHANSGPLNSSTGALFSTQYDFKEGYKLRKFWIIFDSKMFLVK
jgi:hypothetical protein